MKLYKILTQWIYANKRKWRDEMREREGGGRRKKACEIVVYTV